MNPTDKYLAIRKSLEAMCKKDGFAFRWEGDAMSQLCYPYLEARFTNYKAIGRDAVSYEAIPNSTNLARYVVGRRSFIFSVRAIADGGSQTATAGGLLDNLRLAMASDDNVDRQIDTDFAVVDAGTVSELGKVKGSNLSQAVVDIECETIVNGDECAVQTFDKIMTSSNFLRPDASVSSAQITGEMP